MTHHQSPLFDQPTLNTTKSQKEAMNQAAKNCGLSRDQIVARMNDLAVSYGISLVANGGLTLDTFEKWINPNELNRQMPTKALPVFCAAVRDTSALDVIARPVGAMVIGPEDQNLLKWAKAYFRARHARRTMRTLDPEG